MKSESSCLILCCYSSRSTLPPFSASLRPGDIIRVDQEELETVIPAPGGRVLVVAGEHRGAKGTLEALDTGAFQALVLLEGEKEPKRFEYEHICKLTSL